VPWAQGIPMNSSKIAFFLLLPLSSFCCFAQSNSSTNGIAKPEETLAGDDVPKKNEVIVGYKVIEQIGTAYGSNVTTYRVGSLDLINQNDLGPNNKRTIIPIYGKAKGNIAPVSLPSTSLKTAENSTLSKPQTVMVVIPHEQVKTKKQPKGTKIDVVSTYERVLNNGYKSVDMLKKVADKSFFDGDLEESAKWYTQLFELTTDLDPVYYYRYAESLKAIHETEKAKKMMDIFQAKKV
jgi:hypothetical protein